MLLRTSSAPILSSLLHYSQESSIDKEQILHLPRAISFLSLNQTLLETELDHTKNTLSSKRRNFLPRSSKVLKNQQNEVKDVKKDKNCSSEAKIASIQGLFFSSGLDKTVMDDQEDSINGGGGSNDGHGRRRDCCSEGNNDHGRDRTNAYYQNMIEANPNDALLLGNYAKFLKEVCGDYCRAKEFLERAILANADGDGNILSQYADLVWKTDKNHDRAEEYFDQAIKSSPHDCYVMASYAKFLWEVEEEDDEMIES